MVDQSFEDNKERWAESLETPLIIQNYRICMKVGLFLPQMAENITAENILYIATEAKREA